MAEFIQPGTTIRDAHKREWVVGDPVGRGGFGMIYLCDQKVFVLRVKTWPN